MEDGTSSSSSSAAAAPKPPKKRRAHVKRLSDAVQSSQITRSILQHRRESTAAAAAASSAAEQQQEVFRVGLASLNEQLCNTMLGVVLHDNNSHTATTSHQFQQNATVTRAPGKRSPSSCNKHFRVSLMLSLKRRE